MRSVHFGVTKMMGDAYPGSEKICPDALTKISSSKLSTVIVAADADVESVMENSNVKSAYTRVASRVVMMIPQENSDSFRVRTVIVDVRLLQTIAAVLCFHCSANRGTLIGATAYLLKWDSFELA